MGETRFGPSVLAIDAPAEACRIARAVETQVLARLRRRGLVVGVSGGVDSAVVAALAALAIGGARVLALLLPERDSSPESLDAREADGRAPRPRDRGGRPRRRSSKRPAATPSRPRRSARSSPSTATAGAPRSCSRRSATGERLNVFSLVVESPGGEVRRSRLPLDAFRRLVAATNMKQRTRKQIEYFHADRLGFAVAGTPNRLEYDQGFFVKNGDGAADVKPIAHLYKTQVYALAEHLERPRRDPRAPADDRHLLARADAGRVLLRAPVPGDGPLPLGQEPRDGSAPRSPPRSGCRARPSPPCTATSIASDARRATSTSARSWSSR